MLTTIAEVSQRLVDSAVEIYETDDRLLLKQGRVLVQTSDGSVVSCWAFLLSDVLLLTMTRPELPTDAEPDEETRFRVIHMAHMCDTVVDERPAAVAAFAQPALSHSFLVIDRETRQMLKLAPLSGFLRREWTRAIAAAAYDEVVRVSHAMNAKFFFDLPRLDLLPESQEGMQNTCFDNEITKVEGWHHLLHLGTLHACARLRDRQGARALLAVSTDQASLVNQRDRANQTPLHYAVINDDVVMLDLLTDAGAVYKTDDTLLAAVRNDSAECLRRLVSLGHDLRARVSCEEVQGNLLHLATFHGSIRCISMLLDALNVNSRSNMHQTPLFHAVRQGHLAVVRFLISRGAYVNAKDSSERRVLHFTRSTKIAECLVSHGARLIHQKDKTLVDIVRSRFGPQILTKLRQAKREFADQKAIECAEVHVKPKAQWQKDENATSCAACSVKFQLSTRKHHCRVCGQVCCQKCTHLKVRVEGKSKRCCDACFVRIRSM